MHIVIIQRHVHMKQKSDKDTKKAEPFSEFRFPYIITKQFVDMAHPSLRLIYLPFFIFCIMPAILLPVTIFIILRVCSNCLSRRFTS